MFAEEIRRVLATTPRGRLADLSATLWKSYAAGAVSESDAQALAEAIQARKSVQEAPVQPRRIGSRPRSPESMERRRRWTSSGWLPPQLASRFTMGENAVLSVVAAQVAKHARCTLSLEHIAALAGVSRSTAKTALREARALGLLTIEHRPSRPFRHETNIVKVTSPEWRSWLSFRRSSQGGKSSTPANTKNISGEEKRAVRRQNDRHWPEPHRKAQDGNRWRGRQS